MISQGRGHRLIGLFVIKHSDVRSPRSRKARASKFIILLRSKAIISAALNASLDRIKRFARSTTLTSALKTQWVVLEDQGRSETSFAWGVRIVLNQLDLLFSQSSQRSSRCPSSDPYSSQGQGYRSNPARGYEAREQEQAGGSGA